MGKERGRKAYFQSVISGAIAENLRRTESFLSFLVPGQY